MSRKRKAPVRKVYPDPKFHSEIVSKFINSIMYDGKRKISSMFWGNTETFMTRRKGGFKGRLS